MSIVGARPQFVKLGPVSRAMAQRAGDEEFDDCIVHTGQHYDTAMSEVFFKELELPVPAHNLGIGSGSHGAQTARMLEGIEKLILADRPDMVVIYGDTNSTVAGALAASKLHVPVAHVEAGLRSFNRAMPEELNRIVADHVSDLLLAPTQTAMRNLSEEALADRSVWTGDVMYDAVLFNKEVARRRSTVLENLALHEGEFGVVTLHRAENTDDGSRLAAILAALAEIAEGSLPLVFPVHPRTRAAIDREMPGWVAPAKLMLVEPVGYLDMLRLVDAARLALTDSGGLQKEAFFLGRPCVTLRDETEWLETVNYGGNVLVGAEGPRIKDAVTTILQGSGDIALEAAASEAFGDGHSARRIVEAIEQFLGH